MRRRRAATPAPTPSAARPAAITPGCESSRSRWRSTSGQRRSSTSSAAASGVGSVGGQLDRLAEGHADPPRSRQRAGEQLLGAGDRAGDDRRPGLQRQAGGALVRLAEDRRVADPRALGEQREQPAVEEDLPGRLDRLGVGGAAADREGAEPDQQLAGAALEELVLAHEADRPLRRRGDEERVPEALVVGGDDHRPLVRDVLGALDLERVEQLHVRDREPAGGPRRDLGGALLAGEAMRLGVVHGASVPGATRPRSVPEGIGRGVGDEEDPRQRVRIPEFRVVIRTEIDHIADDVG